MSLYTAATLAAGRLFPPRRRSRSTTRATRPSNPLLPPWKELVPGSIASIIVFTLLYKYAGPVIKKSFADRTAGSRSSSTTPPLPRSQPRPRPSVSARPRVTSTPSAPDCTPKPTLRPRRCSPTAASVSRPRWPNSRPAPRATSPLPQDAGSDELRAEIARYSGTAVDRIVSDTLDDAAQQDLIEGFIARVGAGVAS